MNVQQLTTKFFADLSVAMRKEVLDELMQKLGGTVEAAIPAPREPFSPLQVRTVKKRAKRRVGQKRTEAQIAAAQERVFARVQKAPGSSSEMLQRSLELPAEDIVLPIQRLLASKRIRKTGEKRSTKYYPAAKSKKN